MVLLVCNVASKHLFNINIYSLNRTKIEHPIIRTREWLGVQEIPRNFSYRTVTSGISFDKTVTDEKMNNFFIDFILFIGDANKKLRIRTFT